MIPLPETIRFEVRISNCEPVSIFQDALLVTNDQCEKYGDARVKEALEAAIADSAHPQDWAFIGAAIRSQP